MATLSEKNEGICFMSYKITSFIAILNFFVANLNLKTICNELATVALKYFNIGLFMNVPFHKLKEFEKDDHPLPSVINYLVTNGISEDCPLSWRCIVEALESNSVSEPGLAREISKKYCKADAKQGMSFSKREA